MCQPSTASATATPQPAPISTPGHAGGSRRRRLWELDGHAFCPVIGVCLQIPQLRRLARKTLGDLSSYSDYEVHCTVVAECRRRSPLSEAVQKELENSFPLVIRAALQLKCTESLARWWSDCRDSADWAGALWAVLTHPRCSAELEQMILGEVHMLQHQVGMATRADLSRLDALFEENAVLARELGAAQVRSQQQACSFAQKLDEQQTANQQLRTELVQTQAALSQQGAELARLLDAAPELPQRQALAEQNQQQGEEIHALQRALLQARQEAERLRRQADEAHSQLQAARARLQGSEGMQPATPPTLERLCNQAVLCVGGRTASVPIYRQLIEHTGARFLHHDGGEEDNSNQLDATLAAADLVICQAGCISHNAYWRVKDHCKRTGKRCVFIETPSRSALERALEEMSWRQGQV